MLCYPGTFAILGPFRASETLGARGHRLRRCRLVGLMARHRRRLVDRNSVTMHDVASLSAMREKDQRHIHGQEATHVQTPGDNRPGDPSGRTEVIYGAADHVEPCAS